MASYRAGFLNGIAEGRREGAAEIADLKSANALLHGLVTNRDHELSVLTTVRDAQAMVIQERDAEIERLRSELQVALDRFRLVREGGDAGERAVRLAIPDLEDAIAVEQSAPPEGDNDPNGNRDLAREIDGS